MSNVVCPNCNVITPSLQHCMSCNAFLGDLLEQAGTITTTTEPSFFERIRRFFSRMFGGETTTGWEDAAADIDPHLLRHCSRNADHGVRHLTTDGASELAAIAKVTDLKAFASQKGVRVITSIPPVSRDDQTTIVTARITTGESDIRRLARHDCVRNLKAVRRVRPFLEKTREDVFGARRSLRTPTPANDGRGIIIGIVDFGLDLMHRNFRNEDDTTRVLALWDQNGTAKDRSERHPYGYGRLIDKAKIDSLLGSDDNYHLLGYQPSPDSVFDTGSHGTYVADIAAGNGRGSNAPGIAPNSDIVFVDLSTSDTPLQGIRSIGNTFGDSIHLVEAVKFIFDYAGDRPCVVNLSLGTNGGPHDGSTPVEEALDRLVREKPNRAVVVAAGNSFEDKIHASGTVKQNEQVDLGWKIPRFDSTSNEVEVWYSGEDEFALDVLDPDGELVMQTQPGERSVVCNDRYGLLIVVNRRRDRSNGRNSINVFFERTLRDGVWTLRLKGKKVKDGVFHAWIERDERGQSRFVESVEREYEVSGAYTLGSIACGKDSIVVGSYDAHDPELPLSRNSSSGPTADGREKPELAAPGEGVLAAQSGTVVLRHRQSGTSLAAAVVSGTIALMLAELRTALDGERIDLSIDQIRTILFETARRGKSGRWEPKLGYGRLHATDAVRRVAELAHGTTRTAPASEAYRSRAEV